MSTSLRHMIVDTAQTPGWGMRECERLAYTPALDPCARCGAWLWQIDADHNLSCRECNATLPLLVGRD